MSTPIRAGIDTTIAASGAYRGQKWHSYIGHAYLTCSSQDSRPSPTQSTWEYLLRRSGRSFPHSSSSAYGRQQTRYLGRDQTQWYVLAIDARPHCEIHSSVLAFPRLTPMFASIVFLVYNQKAMQKTIWPEGTKHDTFFTAMLLMCSVHFDGLSAKSTSATTTALKVEAMRLVRGNINKKSSQSAIISSIAAIACLATCALVSEAHARHRYPMNVTDHEQGNR